MTSGDTRLERLSPTLDAKWPPSCSLGPPIDSLWAPRTTWTPLAATHSTAGTFESLCHAPSHHRQLVAINSASATIAINNPSFSGVKGRECATARSLPSRLPVEFVRVRAFPRPVKRFKIRTYHRDAASGCGLHVQFCGRTIRTSLQYTSPIFSGISAPTLQNHRTITGPFERWLSSCRPAPAGREQGRPSSFEALKLGTRGMQDSVPQECLSLPNQQNPIGIRLWCKPIGGPSAMSRIRPILGAPAGVMVSQLR